MRAATVAKRISVVLGVRFGIARAHGLDQVCAAATAAGFEVLDSTTLDRSHVVVLRRMAS